MREAMPTKHQSHTTGRHRRNHSFLLILPVVFLISTITAFAAEPITLDADALRGTPIGLHVEYLRDPGGTRSHDEILRMDRLGAAQWTAAKSKSLSFGYITDAVWIKFSATNPEPKEKEWYLEVGYSHLDHVDLYIPTGDGGYRVKREGDSKPFYDREYRYRNFIFPVLQRPGTQTYYLRVTSTGAIRIPLTIWSRQVLAENSNNESLFFGLLYGILLIMIAYNFFVFLSIRDRDFLWYLLFVTAGLIFSSTLNGTGFQYLWPQHPWMNNNFIISVHCCSIFLYLFFRSFLNIRDLSPTINRFIILMTGIHCAAILLSLLVPYRYSVRFTAFSGILCVSIVLLISLYCLLRRVQFAQYFAMAFLPLLVLLFPTGLTYIGVIPGAFLLEWGADIGLISMMVFFSFTLGKKLNTLQLERISAQAETIRIQQDATATLERKVEERTGELAAAMEEVTRVNERLIKSNASLEMRNRTIENEIALARKIQNSLIPLRTPAPYISAYYKPMETVGGDFYDFIAVPGSERVGVFLSDVSGHGVPAAFITSMIKTILLQAGDRLADPAGLLGYMNDVLRGQTAGNFVTAFYGIYDPRARSFMYSNAGHNRPYLLSSDRVIQLQGSTGIAVAVFSNDKLMRANKRFENRTETLEPGSKLLLYTDGLIESRPVGGGAFFMYASLERILRDNAHVPCDGFLAELMTELRAFRQSESFEDDICLICLDVV